MRSVRYVIIIMLFILSLGIQGCERPEISKEEEIVPVKTYTVVGRTVRDVVDYIGDIKAEDEAYVYPRVPGKVIEIVKDEGNSVAKGEVIVYVDRDEVGFEFEKAPVESPLQGVVGRVYVDKGTQVSQQTPVALVVSMEKVKVQLDLPEKYIPRVSAGQAAEITIDAYPEKIFSGKVVTVSPVVDISTRTAPVEIIIPNSEYFLKPGMYARVKLILKEHVDVPVVLKESVMGKIPNVYVYVFQDGFARKRVIQIGMREGALFEVVDGLDIGDEVVIMGQQKLKDGMIVRRQQNNDNGGRQ